MINVNNLYDSVKKIVEETLEYQNGIDIYTVQSVNSEDFTINIKELNGAKNFSNVDIISNNLGNGKGCLQFPEVNDLVIVCFLSNSEKPLIIGSIFNKYMGEKDSVIQVENGEYFVNNKINGSYVFIDKNNNIKLKTNNIDNESSELNLNSDGSFKIKNKDGYGVSVDSSGNMTLSALTINHTQTPLN